MSKRPKIQCEICGEKNKNILHRHHIIPKTDIRCTNDDMNLAILCPSCHSKTHDGTIKIIGVFPSTKPSGKMLVYVGEDNVCNVPALQNAEPYYNPQPRSMKVNYAKG